MPRRRSRRPDSPNQVSCACASAGRSSRSAASRADSVSRVAVSAASTSARRSSRTVSSASSCSRAVRAVGEVVGHQPGPGVAHVGLDGLGLAGHLGLPAQRLELAPDLAEQVGEPGQVALGRVELAERLLLALAVLEDAGGLLDEAAAVLGGGVQDRVELSLPHDHVHLAADAGVAEQLLDVEQAAGVAVDGVLGPAVAEHRAADRDLGVLDRQGAVGVVDGQLDLGATQRRAARRTGEDDVLHLAAAQRLGALLTHHPGERVDDVGLAGPVGAHDAGDPGFELERRRGGEGLEALEREALEVQRLLSLRRRRRRS